MTGKTNEQVQTIASTLQKRKPHLMGHQQLREAAVLVPLIEQGEEMHVLFEVRSHTLRRQPGEICFPGGRLEQQDGSASVTAVRETCEELGLHRDQVELLGELDVLVGHSQLIYSFVGQIEQSVEIKPNQDEVAEIFTVPLSELLQTEPVMHQVAFHVQPHEDFPFDLIPNGRDYAWGRGVIPQYFYQWQGRVIWGLTARILHHFLEVIR